METYAYIINFLAYRDQKMRESGTYDESLDTKNQMVLEKIIQKIRFPSISKVGKKASWNAWLIAQHSELEFMRDFYTMLCQEEPHNYDRKNREYLEDRILTIIFRKQIHGTQYKKDTSVNLVKVPLIAQQEGEELLVQLRYQDTEKHGNLLSFSHKST